MSPEECRDKLEQLILDEDELVTYKLLSKEVKIHVNEAKKCLHDFQTEQNSKKEIKLHAYYFLSGIVVKDGIETRKIVIVSEENLEKTKKEFKEITSCHIYSLNKGGSHDTSSLYSSQSWCKKWAEEHREQSAIKHPNVIIQAPVIKKAEPKKSDAKPSTSKAPPIKQVKNEGATSLFKNNKPVENGCKSSVGESSAAKTDETTNNTKSSTEATNNNSPNSESKDQKKSTLSSLWQKLEDKTKNGKNENSKPETKGKKAAAKTVGKNNIMSMFSKQAEKNAVNPVKKVTNNSTSAEHISPEKETKHVSPKVETNTVKEVSNQTKSKRKTPQRKSKRATKQISDNESDEDIKPKKKKHRRICTMDDSESESENEEAQDRAQRSLLDTEQTEEITAPVSDDSEEPIPPTPPVVSNKGKGKKKIWKTVQKTFQDEDGFLVSKQEKILVSASDSDEEPLPSKKTPSKEEPKQNTFLYRKQASLTSFFKQR